LPQAHGGFQIGLQIGADQANGADGPTLKRLERLFRLTELND
jgi:hypothetical protein